MKKYFYYKQNGDVAMISDGLITCNQNIFSHKQLTLTNDDVEKIDKNYVLKIKDGKLEKIKPNHLAKLDVKTELENANSVEDLKQIILNNFIK